MPKIKIPSIFPHLSQINYLCDHIYKPRQKLINKIFH